jgi:hypothetical protein
LKTTEWRNIKITYILSITICHLLKLPINVRKTFFTTFLYKKLKIKELNRKASKQSIKLFHHEDSQMLIDITVAVIAQLF